MAECLVDVVESYLAELSKEFFFFFEMRRIVLFSVIPTLKNKILLFLSLIFIAARQHKNLPLWTSIYSSEYFF